MTATIAFILGICFIVLIAALMMGMVAFFKVIKLNKKLMDNFSNLYNEAETNRTELDNRFKDVYAEILRANNEIYRTLDSRFNKFESKIPTNK